ncbi:DEAD/DEAH box helicase [Streptomyces sp. NPDC090088]|uniref:DEAD/DEAH box helicase n=1 Tax=Streptomyces sp. NPDC090088 TaxID=3365944 RepID=UPI00381D78CD
MSDEDKEPLADPVGALLHELTRWLEQPLGPPTPDRVLERILRRITAAPARADAEGTGGGICASNVWSREPRHWQREAFDDFTSRLPATYHVAACPGGGKTEFALAVAKHLITEKLISRVIVVVPTKVLSQQWIDRAGQFGIDLYAGLPSNHRSAEDHPTAPSGTVITYGLLASVEKASTIRTRAVPPSRTLAIFDEAHHAGENKRWRKAVQTAFKGTRFRLLLTGAADQGEGRIPFAAYRPETDRVPRMVPDFSYDYGRGVREQSIRNVDFRFYDSDVREVPFGQAAPTGGVTEAAAHDSTPNLTSRAMDLSSGWLAALMPAVHRELTDIRRSVPDAGCLILADGPESAQACGRLVAAITGHLPAVATADGPEASAVFKKFAASRAPYLVAIPAACEGLDIPRLRVLLRLTADRSDLRFTQSIARVTRIPDPAHCEPAVVFLPALDTLHALARDVEESITHQVATLERLSTRLQACLPHARRTLSGEHAFGPTPSWPDEEPNLPYGGRHAQSSAASPEPAGVDQPGRMALDDGEPEPALLGSECDVFMGERIEVGSDFLLCADGQALTEVALVREFVARGRLRAEPGGRIELTLDEAEQMASTAAEFVRRRYRDDLDTATRSVARRHRAGDLAAVRADIDRETGAISESATISQIKQGIALARQWAACPDGPGQR